MRRRNPSHGLQGSLSRGPWTHWVIRVQIMSPKQIALVGGLLVIWPGPIQAHDIYTDLLTPSGLPCCHDGDCRPVPYRLTPKGVQMLLTSSGSISRGAASNTAPSLVTVVRQEGFIGAGCETRWGTLPAVRSYRPSPPPLIRTHCTILRVMRNCAGYYWTCGGRIAHFVTYRMLGSAPPGS